MKFLQLVLSVAFAALAALPATAQSKTSNLHPNSTTKPPATSSSTNKDCTCSGTGCNCSCEGKCCVCTCDGGCACECVKAVTVSLSAGSTVDSAVLAISAIGLQVTTFSGGDQIVPFNITTTGWQALARLSMLPGVKLAVTMPDTWKTGALTSRPGEPQAMNRLREVRPIPMTEVISLCVHEEAGLPAALEGLSRLTGYAFDVYGNPAQRFTLTAKGPIDEVVSQLASAAGVTITIAH